MDISSDFRQHYLAAAPHSFYISLCWITGGLLGDFVSTTASILFFLIASMVNFPVGEVFRKVLFKAPPAATDLKALKTLFMLMSFIIPMALPVVYFACKANLNYFYPSMAVIVGAHYLPFFYGYKLRSFLIFGTVIWMAGTMCGLYVPGSFSIAAYCTGGLIFLMAVANYRKVLKEVRP